MKKVRLCYIRAPPNLLLGAEMLVAPYEWLSPKDLARPVSKGGYGISPSLQAKLRMKQQIPFSKRGRMIYYRRDRIDQWLNDHEIV